MIAKQSDKWLTPPEVFDPLNEEFKFCSFDPCPISWNASDEDGLSIDWQGESIFVNPPYSDAANWIKKASVEASKGKTIVMLINAITDTKAFHEYIYGKAEIRFIAGRIKFINPENPAKRTPNPKPSMIVVFRSPIISK